MDYLLYEQKIDVKQFSDAILRKVLYSSVITNEDSAVNIQIKTKGNEEN